MTPQPRPLRPLPIRPRPHQSETVGSYIRRLARANHLHPSYLHGYLCGPPQYFGRPQPERLAALAGRPLSTLQLALTGLSRPPRATTTAASQDNARRQDRAEARTALFTAICRDAELERLSIRALATRHRVHRRTILQALHDPRPPQRKRHTRPALVMVEHLQDLIDAMLDAEQTTSAMRIWQHLIDEHDAEVSYSSISSHVALRRSAPRLGNQTIRADLDGTTKPKPA